MCSVLRQSEVPASSTPATLGLARSLIVTVHVDHAGPFMGKTLTLLVVDAMSNWLEVKVVNSIKINVTECHPGVEVDLCDARVARTTGVRQWARFHER